MSRAFVDTASGRYSRSFLRASSRSAIWGRSWTKRSVADRGRHLRVGRGIGEGSDDKSIERLGNLRWDYYSRWASIHYLCSRSERFVPVGFPSRACRFLVSTRDLALHGTGVGSTPFRRRLEHRPQPTYAVGASRWLVRPLQPDRGRRHVSQPFSLGLHRCSGTYRQHEPHQRRMTE